MHYYKPNPLPNPATMRHYQPNPLPNPDLGLKMSPELAQDEPTSPGGTRTPYQPQKIALGPKAAKEQAFYAPFCTGYLPSWLVSGDD